MYNLYGDESVIGESKETCLYGVVLVDQNKVALAESLISKHKQAFGVTAEIHMREIYNSDSRKKLSDWRRKKIDEIMEFLRELTCNLTKECDIIFSAGIVGRSYPIRRNAAVGTDRFRQSDWEMWKLTLSYQFAIVPFLIDGGFNHIKEIFVDENRNKIKLGEKSSRLTSLLVAGAVLEKLSEIRKSVQATPVARTSVDRPGLIQIADLLTYCLAKTLIYPVESIPYISCNRVLSQTNVFVTKFHSLKRNMIFRGKHPTGMHYFIGTGRISCMNVRNPLLMDTWLLQQQREVIH